MAINAAFCKQYLGRTVHVHSIYGVHRGVLTHVMSDGIMLGNPVRMASCDRSDPVFSYGDYHTNMNSEEYENVFFGGGLFLPFGGIFGFGFGGGFFW
jgi:hypothetical protein